MSHKNRWRIIADLRARLVENFPQAFAPKGADKQPLKIGIFDDLRTALPDLAPWRIKGALFDYTRGPTYLGNVTAGAERIGLDGAPAGIVTQAEAESAAIRLACLPAKRGAPNAGREIILKHLIGRDCQIEETAHTVADGIVAEVTSIREAA